MAISNITPYRGPRATLDLFISDQDYGAEETSQSEYARGEDLSQYVMRASIKGFINNGYMAKIQVQNPNFGLIRRLIKGGPALIQRIRHNPIPVWFRINQEAGGIGYPIGSTRMMKGYLAMIYPHGKAQGEYVELIVIDPTNWAMRIGDASGGAYEGKISDVIRKIISKYAPTLKTTIAETNDSPAVWWQMRRSPRDMLSHLLYLASSFTTDKTPWTIGVFNDTLKIGPITKNSAQATGYYVKMDVDGSSSIMSWEGILNPSIGHYEMGLATAGVTSTLGEVYDKSNNQNAIVNETNTGKKLVPINSSEQNLATKRPLTETFSAGRYGRTFVQSPPEYFSDIEVNQQYEDYFNSYARSEYVKGFYKLFNLDVTVIGHGVWDNTLNLGSEVVYLQWRNQMSDTTRQEAYFLNGNWLAYGWEHVYTPGRWDTILKLSKFDSNATGKKVGFSQDPRL